jgi:hypothetical protein
MTHQELVEKAVYYLGLAELAHPRLAASKDYSYALRALDACWRWIECKDVSAKTIYDLYFDDEGYGVGASMSAEHDRKLWHAWCCVTTGVAMVAHAAYRYEGPVLLPADLEGVDLPEATDQTADSFRELFPMKGVMENYYTKLATVSGSSITRSQARDLVFTALRDAVLN